MWTSMGLFKKVIDPYNPNFDGSFKEETLGEANLNIDEAELNASSV